MGWFLLVLLCITLYFPLAAEQYDLPDPYPEIYESIEVLPYRMHGWHQYQSIFDPLLEKKQIHTVIEVGVFLGNLTSYIAPKLPNGGRYFAIDHWKGSEEHAVPGTVEFTCLENMYEQFLSNMIHLHLQDTVIPVRMTSLAAAKKLKKLGIKGDLIFIDAAHDYVSVYQDIALWFDMLAPHGVFCGDDWHYGGVRTAVQQFAKRKGLSIYTNGNFWQFLFIND